MDFKEYKCPVCDKQFADGDDIVVCPECGAPHHRACYEAENKCAFESKHAEGFDFESYANPNNNSAHSENPDTVICPRCGTSNRKGMFYCGKCGFPLSAQQTQQQNGQPFSGFGTAFGTAFDPMAGVNPEEDMGDGVTAGEVSRYVQKNTPYFIRVFNNIRLFNNGRFNFCAFLFGGAYLLYRKMYKKGLIFSILWIVLSAAELFAVYKVSSGAMNQLFSSDGAVSYGQVLTGLMSLSVTDQMMLMISSLCAILSLVLRIIVGFFSNRWYFLHCKGKIKKIKEASENPQAEFETKGGVNLAIAISVMAIIVFINELPAFISF